MGTAARETTKMGTAVDAGDAVRFENAAAQVGGRTIWSDVNISVPYGQFVAVLGPNGVGKSTLIKSVLGLVALSAGSVTVLGRPAGQAGREIGYLPQRRNFDSSLRVRGIDVVSLGADGERWGVPLPFAGRYLPSRRAARERVREVIDLVGLSPKRGQRVARLSGGQQRRLDMAVALAGDPELLFLDEPTTGFDPAARREAWEVVKDLASLGKTVLLTTHFMDEAQYLADRVVVLAGGQIVAEGAPGTLAVRDSTSAWVRYRLPEGVRPPDGLGGPAGSDGMVEVHVGHPTSDLYRLLRWAMERGIDLEGLEVKRPTLEDVYLDLTAPKKDEPA